MTTLWMSTMMEAAARATVLLGVAALVALLLRHRSAAVRHLVWSLALTSALMLPATTALLPALRLPVPDALVSTLDQAAQIESPNGQTGRAGPQLAQLRASSVRQTVESRDRDVSLGPVPSTSARSRASTSPGGSVAWGDGLWQPSVFVAVWLLGVVVLGTRSLLSVWSARRLGDRAEEIVSVEWRGLLGEISAELGVHRPVRLLRSQHASTPMTWGWWRPVIVVAQQAEQWSLDRRVLVLRHELAHVKRGDYVTQLVAQWVTAVYWFHPLAWLAARQLRVEREHACDDEVLRLGTRASTYARHLLDIARSVHPTTLNASATIAMARRSQLEGRLMAILDPHIRRVTPPATAMGIVVGLTMLALTASVVTPDAQTTEPTAGRPGVDATVDGEPAGSIAMQTQTDQDRAGERRDTVEVERQRVAEELSRRTRDIETRVRVQLDDVDVDDLNIDVEAIARDAEALAREMAERFEYAEFAQDDDDADDDDDAPLDPRLVEAFIGALGDSDAEVREEAASALGRFRVAEAVTPLVGTLDDENPDVREQAARALGRIRDPGAVDGLVDAVGDEVPDVAEQAVRALGSIRDERAVGPLTGALNAADADVREQAARALGRIRSEDAVPALGNALRDEHADVREQAARALGQIRSANGVDALAAALDDSVEDVREQVVRALSRIGDPRAIDGLVAALDVAEGEALEDIVRAIGRIGGDEAIDALLRLMDSPNDAVRREVIRALGEERSGDRRPTFSRQGWRANPDQNRNPNLDPDPDPDPDPNPNANPNAPR